MSKPKSLATKSEVEKFKNFLSERGAEVLIPTNGYELIRFRSGDLTSIIYRRANGRLTMTGEADKAFSAYKSGGQYRATPATKRRSNRKSSVRIRALRKRDGDLCFLCQEKVSIEEESEEHLVSITHGGPNHISNTFLAHVSCNLKVGTKSAPEKIKIHDDAVRRKIYGFQEQENKG